jgi:hypothetical protein
VHKLTVDSKGNIFLDEKKLEHVAGYELKCSARQPAELRIVLSVIVGQVAFESEKK